MDKHFDHVQSEMQIRETWDREKTFETKKSAGPIFSIDTPPPTVSGKLHIGHVFSYTHTDIIARYKRLSGFSVFYPLGFDDNGLPTERFVELKREISPYQMSRSAFVKICREEVVAVEAEFQKLWTRLGLSVDWEKTYSTGGDFVQKISQASFLKLLKDGHIYRKEEPAIYCPVFRTSVSQADLEDVEKETFFNDIQFKCKENDEALVISTTRPELLPSCVALFYNPRDPRYKHLNGKHALVPLYGHAVPILEDDKVAVEKGTGLVMCCTFGDKTDIEWFKKHNLPYRPSIGLDGRMLEATGALAGKKVPEARLEILELLKKESLVLKQQTIKHAVSIYERSKKEVEFLMLPQWFVKVLPFKKELLAMADQIEWHPSFMKTRFIDWVENLQWDWCISRQRFAGIPFPVWFDKHTGKIFVPDEKNLPIDPRESAFPGVIPAGVELVPDTDVMDTWNTSSLSPYICQALYEGSAEHLFSPHEAQTHFIPMSMRPQAHDIIRTWAFYTMVKSLMHHKKAPWNSIVISGHVLSPDGGKISKSKGNNPLEPEKLLSSYPADVIRYWTASGTLGHDVAFSENTLKIGSKLVTKLWNACRLVEEHTAGISNKKPAGELGAINEWILHRMSEVFEQYKKYFEQHEFSLALGALETFFWNDFCDNYLELIKFHFFRPDAFDAQAIAATRWTLYQTALRLLQLFSPFIPFVTESLYQQLYKGREGVASIHITEFSKLQEAFSFPKSVINAGHLLTIVSQVRKLKSDKNLSLKTELADCIIIAPTEITEFLKTQEGTLKGVTSAHLMTYATTSTGTSFLEEREGIWRATICLT
ncbi:TPA: valine--tRNA ligase [Candidatus Dependentiae bacterium]|nr:MAG: Valine-tRNA ligase [candidate division TM6 bacterium GW2011_GWF2_43_87]HBL98887.1 valine--tRNA ligase [Candidatus Dependentiae bacterium]